ncbi:hypothetical protein N2152v2_010052 [Parachlorella kessleri]
MAHNAGALTFESQQYDALASKPEAQLRRDQRELVAAYRSNRAAEQLLLHPDQSPKLYGEVDEHSAVHGLLYFVRSSMEGSWPLRRSELVTAAMDHGRMRPGRFLERIDPAPDNGVAIVKHLAYFEAETAVQGFDSEDAQFALIEMRGIVEMLAPEEAAQEAAECLEEFEEPLTAEELQMAACRVYFRVLRRAEAALGQQHPTLQQHAVFLANTFEKQLTQNQLRGRATPPGVLLQLVSVLHMFYSAPEQGAPEGDFYASLAAANLAVSIIGGGNGPTYRAGDVKDLVSEAERRFKRAKKWMGAAMLAQLKDSLAAAQNMCLKAGVSAAPSCATLRAGRMVITQKVAKPELTVGGVGPVEVGLVSGRGSASMEW